MKRLPTWMAAALIATAGSGCILDELTQNSGPPASGTVTVLFNGKTYTTEALAQAGSEPFNIEGNTDSLTFYVKAVSTAAGTPLTLLAADGDSADLLFTILSGNQLEIHAGGTGCVAADGSLDLVVGTDGKLAGAFDVAGSSSGLDGGVQCSATGTLSEIPINR